ncbi:site-specific integrase [Halobacteriovorax sp. JY17]|uniref:tyrosine-type recombinase/integrase n=1 Tax=Halobacteriovorax sp. JY17 TaxID=2014617 RepID=UPI000C3EDEB2|nr:site-specific integrase [Halobacteriovorax sp. JY17]PIK15518.1 MAG: hypothetical protein CES88_02010 [Halobacteriovorax sp. JY17]
MEKIVQKNGTKYRESIYINGSRERSPLFTRKSDAKTWKAQKTIEKDSIKLFGQQRVSKANISFNDYADEWFSEVQQSSRTIRTIEIYEGILRNHIRPFFKEFKLKEIKEEDAMAFIYKLREKGNNAKGRNNIIGVFKTMLANAKKKSYIMNSPAEYLPKEKGELRPTNFLSKEEGNLFLEANKHNEYIHLFKVAIGTGMRLGELCGLKWDRVDFENDQITVSRTRDKNGIRDNTKGGRARIIPMTPTVRSTLEKLKFSSKVQSIGGYVFTTLSGVEIPYGHFYRKMKKALNNAGIERKVRFHDLRHTFASHFMMNGGDIFSLQKIMGHTDIDVTQRYAHLSKDHLRKSIQYMGLVSDKKEISPFLAHNIPTNNITDVRNG